MYDYLILVYDYENNVYNFKGGLIVNLLQIKPPFRIFKFQIFP